MNLKNKLALLGLAMLAFSAMTPTASATVDSAIKGPTSAEVCVYNVFNAHSSNWCGENYDTWATVKYSGMGFGGCLTTRTDSLFNGCR